MNKSWISIAVRPDIVYRSMKVALVVGTILALINHGDRLFSGSLDAVVALKVVLTYLVPYSVASWAAVQTVRDGLAATGSEEHKHV